MLACSRDTKEKHVGLVAKLAIFVEPHLHYHDLTLLVVPLLGLGIAGVKADRVTPSQAAVIPMAAQSSCS